MILRFAAWGLIYAGITALGADLLQSLRAASFEWVQVRDLGTVLGDPAWRDAPGLIGAMPLSLPLLLVGALLFAIGPKQSRRQRAQRKR